VNVRLSVVRLAARRWMVGTFQANSKKAEEAVQRRNEQFIHDSVQSPYSPTKVLFCT